jgi:hypothetical protein
MLKAQHYVRGITGALIGAGLGYVGFRFLAQNGLYAIVLPGACVGMCGGYLSRVRSGVIGGIAALVALVSLVLIEWQFAPFVADNSLAYFVTHLHKVLPAHLIMISIGTAFAFWFGRGRERF